jgi:hypothetical protein
MTQEIRVLVLVLPYQDASGLFDVIPSEEVLTNQVNGVQRAKNVVTKFLRSWSRLAKIVLGCGTRD